MQIDLPSPLWAGKLLQSENQVTGPTCTLASREEVRSRGKGLTQSLRLSEAGPSLHPPAGGATQRAA